MSRISVDIDIDDIIWDMSNSELRDLREDINRKLKDKGRYDSNDEDIEEETIRLEEINTLQEKELFAAIKKIYLNRVRLSPAELYPIFQIAKEI